MEVGKKKEIILKYLSENPNESYAEISRKIVTDYPDDFIYKDMDTLRRYIGTTAKRQEDKSVDIAIQDEKPKWEVVGGNYTWKAGHGSINLSVEFIDRLFYEYSEHGLNLSQTEIINKHNLKVWEWNSIKSTLWLFKKANIFSPYTVENTPTDELELMISEKIRKMFDNTGLQVEKQYNKELNKKYKAVIKKQTLQDVTLQAMILELNDMLPTCGVQPCIRVDKDGDGVINLFIFDIHYGAENRTNHTQKYSPEIVREQLLEIASIVNKYSAAEVNVFFGGDNVEDFSGNMHTGSYKGIAKGMFGAKLILDLYKILVEFLSQINNVKNVYAVPGNHDRATEKREVDSEGSIAEILFEMVKLSFDDKIAFHYDEKIITISIDGIHYIMTHGHFKLTDVSPAELILKYGDAQKFNLLLSGHWHERRVKKDHEQFRHLVCPPLFTGNDYSVNLGFTSSPGFLVVKNNGISNKPIVIDYTL